MDKDRCGIGGDLGGHLESVAPLVYWYLAFMAADLLTGIWAACRTGTFSSKRLSFGMAKKGLAFFHHHSCARHRRFVLVRAPRHATFSKRDALRLCLRRIRFNRSKHRDGRVSETHCLQSSKKLFLTLEKRLENAVESKLDQIGLDDEEKDKKTK